MVSIVTSLPALSHFYIFLFVFLWWRFLLSLFVMIFALFLHDPFVFPSKNVKLFFNWHLKVLRLFLKILLMDSQKVINQFFSFIGFFFLFFRNMNASIRFFATGCSLHFMDFINTVYRMVSIDNNGPSFPGSQLLIFFTSENGIVHGTETSKFFYYHFTIYSTFVLLSFVASD